MSARIDSTEVAELFRSAMRGAIAVKLTGSRSWADVYCGNVEFSFGTWRVTLFNDVMELDYVDSVVAPDGRTAEYDDWFKSPLGMDPTDHLNRGERIALEAILEALKPERT